MSTLSVAIITLNEELNLARTLESIKWASEIIVVDSGSTDRTVEIAQSYGARVFVESWKGFAAQKNSAIEKCTGGWVLSLDADEVFDGHSFIDRILAADKHALGDQSNLTDANPKDVCGISIERINYFLGRPLRWGGFRERKLRLFRRGAGRFENVRVHESLQLEGRVVAAETLAEPGARLLHHAYPTLTGYIEHMNRYSSLSAEMLVEQNGRRGFSFLNIVVRPFATFIYRYFFRLGFLDGREGLLLHLYHSVYVSWKYAKAWEMKQKTRVNP